MLYEPTTLAATASAIAEAAQAYGCDPRKLFERAGLDIDAMQRPGARYPFRAMIRLWREVRRETGDPCIGLVTATRLKPQALHAPGFSWLASRTLLDGFNRMVRYARVANTSLRLSLVDEGHELRLVPRFEAGNLEPPTESAEHVMAFIVRMCRLITTDDFAPLSVDFAHSYNGHIERYLEYFRAPVHFEKPEYVLSFEARGAKQPVPAGNEELARETDRIADRYLATLDPARLQDRVREILLTLLPSGEADQRAVADCLHRSVSTLQRQLKSEGVTYQKVLDDTRRVMAQRLVREQYYSLGQIAYLLGFSDQASFSRAFRRWTGMSPSRFRRE